MDEPNCSIKLNEKTKPDKIDRAQFADIITDINCCQIVRLDTSHTNKWREFKKSNSPAFNLLLPSQRRADSLAPGAHIYSHSWCALLLSTLLLLLHKHMSYICCNHQQLDFNNLTLLSFYSRTMLSPLNDNIQHPHI